MTAPVRVRITAWYVTLLAAALSSLAIFLVVSQRAALEHGVDTALASRARQVALAATGGDSNFADTSDAPLAGLPPAESAAQILSMKRVVLNSAGAPAAERPMLTAHDLLRVHGGHRLAVTRTLGGTTFRMLALPFPGRGGAQVLVVAESLAPVDHAINTLTVFVLVAGPGVLLLASIGGWVLAGHALRPVARMTATAAQIDADGLDRRVAVPPAADELRLLAETLNAMLDRVRAGMADQQRFVANASHELRTPLAVMRAELDVELSRHDLPVEARDVLASTEEEVVRMSGIVENLLTLAQLDERRLALRLRRVDLVALASDVVQRGRRLAEDGGVRIRVVGDPVDVDADPDRLEQAVGNLVENAVKYAGRGGEVIVAVGQLAGTAELTVTDGGPGIPTEALPHLFDRFFRVDEPRARDMGGSGLGLAICREIVRAHGGDVTVISEPGHGSVFAVTLPLRLRSAATLTPISSRHT